MKTFFNSRCRQQLMAVAAAACLALPAVAIEDSYYAFNVHVEAYPVGAGQVYATPDIMTMFRGIDDDKMPYWSDAVDLKFASDWRVMGVWAKPAEGWQLAGYRVNLTDGYGKDCQVRREGGEVVYGPHWWSDSPWVSLPSMITYYDELGEPLKKNQRDSADVAKLIPSETSDYVQMLFTHVRVKVADGHSGMGMVGIPENYIVNDIGQKITIFAYPSDATSTFDGWYLNGELVSKQNQYQLVVDGVATYEARFSNPLARTVNFPVGGGYIEWYSDYDYVLTEDVYAYNPALSDVTLYDESKAWGRDTYLRTTPERVTLEGKKAALLYGSGEMTLYPKSTSPAINPLQQMLFQWSGDTGVRLVGGRYYYVLAPSGEWFELEEGASIAPNRLYIELPASMVNSKLGAPQRIYVDQQSATLGIDDVKAAGTASNQRKGTFTLDGRRVDQPSATGIYVTDGKKIYYRKK